MNEQKRDATHTDETTTRLTQGARGCDRAADLVAHLYAEATPEEDASFKRHLNSCAVCRDELAAFRGVSELVGAERADVLGAAPALDVSELLARAAGGFGAAVEAGVTDSVNEVGGVREVNATAPLPSSPTTPTRVRSAVAAFREFFALSPLWLRAGAAACALLVCALAALTVARAEVRWDADGIAFRTAGGGAERVVEKRVEVPVRTGFTQEQVDALVAERLKDEREAIKRALQQGRESTTAAAATTDAAAGKKKSSPRLLAAGDAPRTQQRRRTAPNKTRRDEQQLAEDELPRLSDLLGGAY